MFVRIVNFHLRGEVLCFKHLKSQENLTTMTNCIRSAEYRYFSFTYFYGKAYFGLAENVRDRV